MPALACPHRIVVAERTGVARWPEGHPWSQGTTTWFSTRQRDASLLRWNPSTSTCSGRELAVTRLPIATTTSSSSSGLVRSALSCPPGVSCFAGARCIEGRRGDDDRSLRPHEGARVVAGARGGNRGGATALWMTRALQTRQNLSCADKSCIVCKGTAHGPYAPPGGGRRIIAENGTFAKETARGLTVWERR